MLNGVVMGVLNIGLHNNNKNKFKLLLYKTNMDSYYRAFVKKNQPDYFTMVVKTDNTGTSNNNQFTFNGAIGNYRVIATQLDNIIDQTPIAPKLGFGGLLNESTITLPTVGIYELKIIPRTSTPFSQIRFETSINVTLQNSGNLIILNNNNLQNGDIVVFTNLLGNTGLVTFTNYFVVNRTINNFQVATTSGGSPVSINNDNVAQMRPYFGDKLKVLRVKSWGNVKWTSFNSAFYGCGNLDVTATNVPDVSLGVNNYINCFRECLNLENSNNSISNWQFNQPSTVISGFFQNCVKYNSNLSNWNLSNVINIQSLFSGALKYNNGGDPGIDNWNVSNVITTVDVFRNCSEFNQNIGSWNVANVTNMSGMFASATIFDNNGSDTINNWNTANVTSLASTFRYSNFNRDISSWNTTKVTTLNTTFRQTPFNKDINTKTINFGQPDEYIAWDVSNVTGMLQTFTECANFNQNIGDWRPVKCLTFAGCFSQCTSFNNGGNDSIKDWQFSTTGNINMTAMFQISAFNQPLTNWNTERVNNMNNMFSNESIFNQNIGSWNVSNVTNMSGMFSITSGLNPFNNGGSDSINNWNVSSVTNMDSMFRNTLFNQPINNWNIRNVTNFNNFMFGKSTANYDSSNLDAIYNSWSLLPVTTGLTINFGNIQYTAVGLPGRQALEATPNLWAILDGGQI
jgi:surface protein